MAEEQQTSPFAKPGFVVAAVVVGVIVVAGIVLGVMLGTRDDPAPNPATTPPEPATGQVSQSPTTEPTTEPPLDPAQASLCGLSGTKLEGRITIAPEATWEYQGTTAYPVSSTYGPGQTDADGVRYCFQHSPVGALFAAANAVVQSTDPAVIRPWLDYFVADGPGRDTLLAEPSGFGDATGVRIRLEGFRLLRYDGASAAVDIALSGSMGGRVTYLSMVYNLVWEDGDWKLTVIDPENPVDVAVIPDSGGYIYWGE
jgi:hypothetical protein